MSVLSAQSIRKANIISPFRERTEVFGLTFGLGPAGYDITLDQSLLLLPHDFQLGSSIEHFTMPRNVIGYVKDKSTWARRGVLVQNTVIEPGWHGYLTLEITTANAGASLLRGIPIAQIVFHWLDEPTEIPYQGKYQDQKPGPQGARS